MYIFIRCPCVTAAAAAALSQPLCRAEFPACPPSCQQTPTNSAAIHPTSGLTRSYPRKYVQGRESVGQKHAVFPSFRFQNRRSTPGLWGGGAQTVGAQTGDLNSLISHKSLSLLSRILKFIGRSRGSWLFWGSAFERRNWEPTNTKYFFERRCCSECCLCVMLLRSACFGFEPGPWVLPERLMPSALEEVPALS